MDLVIFGIVVLLRIGVPLFIPRFPLPAMILAMIIDAADQTIFQAYTNLDLTNYQSYDKALDVYYLAVAYLSTMRNWRHQVAFDTSRFLWYYRLVGVTLFELLHIRAILLIFPNTFEYFFDFYQAVRTRWNPLRMSKRFVIGAAALIWIAIKLPQEYWIHVAQLDTTDFVKEDLFGVPVETGWGEIISDNPLVFAVLLGVLIVAVFAVRHVIRNVLPDKDWNFTFREDGETSDIAPERLSEQVRSMRGRILTIELVEKTVLLALIMIIFVRIVPGTPAGPFEQTVMVAIFLILNMLVSEAIVRLMGWSDQVLQENIERARHGMVYFNLALETRAGPIPLKMGVLDAWHLGLRGEAGTGAGEGASGATAPRAAEPYFSLRAAPLPDSRASPHNCKAPFGALLEPS